MAGEGEISVDPGPGGVYKVAVRQGPHTTSHEVTVPAGLPESLGCGDVPTEELIRESFVFLLEREPPTSILRRFSLDVIGSYFPEYRSEIRVRCGDTGKDK